MNLINTDITPDPYAPQTGDVYEFGEPFVQRLVIEDAPTREDPRVRYRIDGGTDSNLTTVAQFHRHLAGLTDLHGVGRVREYPPITGKGAIEAQRLGDIIEHLWVAIPRQHQVKTMREQIAELKALVAERESDIEKLADMLKDVLARIGTEDAK